MIHSIVIKTTLVFFLINLSAQLFAQPNKTGIIYGKIIDKKTGDGLIGANIYIDNNPQNPKEVIGSAADLDGNFMFEAPFGKHNLIASYIGYESYAKEITVKLNDTLEFEILLKVIDNSCPWESSTPYPQLNGKWKLKRYEKGLRRVFLSKRKRKSTMSFYFPDKTSPGKFSYSDGCNGCGTICFRHIEDGIIEIQKNGMLICTLIGCYKKNEFGAFVSKMINNKVKTIIKNNRKILKIIVDNEKLVLRKKSG